MDPTLLLDAADYEQIIFFPHEKQLVDSCNRTLFVYMLERNDALVSYAARLAQQTGMSIAERYRDVL